MINRVIKISLTSKLLVLVSALLIMGVGIYAYLRLPINAFPDISPKLVQVFTVTQGLAPEEVERYVTYPIEVAMNGLPGLTKTRSVSNFGLSVVNVYFEEDTDIYFARQLVNERLQEARDQIPQGFGDPQMGPISTGMGLILYYYLVDETGERTLEEMRTIQDWIIKFNLQTVKGVTEVLGIGGYKKQFKVIVDPHALLRYNLPLNHITKTIEANNLNVGAQFIEQNNEEFIVRSVGLAHGIKDLQHIVVKSEDGRPIYLKDVAEVRIGGAIRRGLQTLNGQGEVVSAMVVKLYGTNSSTVISRVEDKIAEINPILPQGVKIVPYYQQKDLVERSVATVTNALVQGIALVVIVLMFFMGGFRPSIVVAAALPFSVLFAISGMWFFDISIDLMSFGGLAIAIGMIVDGTIVMVENVDRMLREAGPFEPKMHVVARACFEVGRPIVFSIAIIITVFIPLFTLHGVEGMLFRPLAYTVAMAMLGSLLFAIAAAPVLAYLFMGRPKKRTGQNAAQDIFVVRWLKGPYRPLVGLFIRFRFLSLLLVALLLGIGGVIFPQLGSEFTPTLQEGTMVLRLTMAPSIALTESKQVVSRVERRLLDVPEIETVVSRIGRGEVGAHADPINSSEMFLLLKPKDQWRNSDWTQEALSVAIREQIGEIPGVVTNFTQPIQMTVDELMEGVKAELAIKLFGDDLEVLKQKADEIAAVVKEVPGAADVQPDQVAGKPQLLIRPDRQAIARYGINIAQVQQTIRTAVGGSTAGQIFEGIRRFDIYVRYQKGARATPETIKNILVEAPNGSNVPLKQLATFEAITGPRQITRENNQRFITVQCNVVNRDIGSFVEEAKQRLEQEVDLPSGYLVTWGGQFELQQQANRRLAVVIPITLLLIFIMLYSSFNSLKNALLIVLNIPLALVGGVAGLWLAGENLSVPASVGFIALFGIALENGMVLVTYLNHLLREGMPVNRASMLGAERRLRPVLMTAVTTALGLIPLLLSESTGSEVQRPLAIVVVGGLVTSTLLTLLVLPSLYTWFAIDTAKETQDLQDLQDL